MLETFVYVVNVASLVIIIVVGIAYFRRTHHMPLSRRAEDRRARLYVILMCGATLFALSVGIAYTVVQLLQR